MVFIPKDAPVNAFDHQTHIVCIDDASDILTLLRDILEEDGYRVTTRTHDDTHLDELVGLRPDLITLDYQWNLDGAAWSVPQWLRLDQRTTRVPVILCTGAVHQVSAHREEIDRMGITVVYKPFDIDDFLRVVRDALGHTTPRA
jgi:DNA-binding response OmpR family regulator